MAVACAARNATGKLTGRCPCGSVADPGAIWRPSAKCRLRYLAAPGGGPRCCASPTGAVPLGLRRRTLECSESWYCNSAAYHWRLRGTRHPKPPTRKQPQVPAGSPHQAVDVLASPGEPLLPLRFAQVPTPPPVNQGTWAQGSGYWHLLAGRRRHLGAAKLATRAPGHLHLPTPALSSSMQEPSTPRQIHWGQTAL